MLKKIISALLLIFFMVPQVIGYNPSYFGELSELEKTALTLGENKKCKLADEEIPTIFVPGILASWYSEQGFEDTKIKRWIPDPITHSYDTLFYTFRENGYKLKDVFYEDEYNVYIDGSPKNGLYIFGYDWKKDNKLTATLLNQLIYKIGNKMLEEEGCELESVNIIAHSMGGLVARAMLEDMCVSDLEIEYFKNQTEPRNGQLRNPKSVKCKYPYKINKFITISTPQRGAPGSLPVWEHGNLGETDNLKIELGLKSQLSSKDIYYIDDYLYDSQVYYRIHGYDENIPNGIVSLGQLLPDLDNENSFDYRFQYIFKNGYEITRENYPKNSFLEELNKYDNINKMWDKIIDKYYLYYSDITSTDGKNNIVSFKIAKKMSTADGTVRTDVTEKIKGNNIYDFYEEKKSKITYFIKDIIQNEEGYGGDGTVPTFNLHLYPNDRKNIIENDKFEEIQIDCYNSELDIDGTKKENFLAFYMGESKYELCSHTQTPVLLSSKIYEQISGIELFKNIRDKVKREKEYRKLLIQNIGYLSNYTKKYNSDEGMANDYYFESAFLLDYEHLFKKDSDLYNKFINGDINEDDERFKLEYGSSSKGLTRYEILSPINIIIEDEEGRKIGIDPDTGMIINEIPGAWTSGNTEGSGEPEFFLIPNSVKGINKIKTYGTGDGEYHIEITKPGDSEVEKTIIAGEARENFGEDYIVAFSGSQTGYKDISSSILATLEIEKSYYKTTNDNFNLRYQVRGNYKDVEKIKYKLYFDNKIVSTKTKEISGIINLDLKNIGEYKLELNLLDKSGNNLNNIESKKEIIINKVEYFSLFQREYPKGEGLEKITQDEKIAILKEKYKLKLVKILSKIDKNKLLKLQEYLKENKEKILLKYDDELKKIIVEFILDEIIAYS